jgi:hypothetical protein
MRQGRGWRTLVLIIITLFRSSKCLIMKYISKDRVMVFNATFNNISWRSILLVDKTGVSGENYRPASH